MWPPGYGWHDHPDHWPGGAAARTVLRAQRGGPQAWHWRSSAGFRRVPASAHVRESQAHPSSVPRPGPPCRDIRPASTSQTGPRGGRWAPRRRARSAWLSPPEKRGVVAGAGEDRAGSIIEAVPGEIELDGALGVVADDGDGPAGFARHRVAQPVSPTSAIPARRHARRTVEATVADAIGSYGALDRKNSSRRPVARRPRRRYEAIASPTSTGSGNRSSRAPLPRTTTSAARQSMSSRRRRATSERRKPNRSSVMISA